MLLCPILDPPRAPKKALGRFLNTNTTLDTCWKHAACPSARVPVGEEYMRLLDGESDAISATITMNGLHTFVTGCPSASLAKISTQNAMDELFVRGGGNTVVVCIPTHPHLGRVDNVGYKEADVISTLFPTRITPRNYYVFAL